ncbi:MAG: TatD family deoxyribonuclease, partial [Verrucomicrobiales bacterium]|nr:TatD family deoxyribonuclease [Verrucomicrobiales bacterium]
MIDAHCHLQDDRLAPNHIKEALEAGIGHFVVNGTTESDWIRV